MKLEIHRYGSEEEDRQVEEIKKILGVPDEQDSLQTLEIYLLICKRIEAIEDRQLKPG